MSFGASWEDIDFSHFDLCLLFLRNKDIQIDKGVNKGGIKVNEHFVWCGGDLPQIF